LGKYEVGDILERVLWLILKLDQDLALKVGKNLGVDIPSKIEKPINQEGINLLRNHIY